MPSINEDPEAIEGLRKALPRFEDRQSASLGRVERELQLTQQALVEARERAEREVARCNRALQACIAARFAMGGYGDCGPEQWALDDAEDWLATILREQREVDIEGEAFERAEHHYLDYIETTLPDIEAGLDARIEGLESYLAWRLSYRPSAGHAAAPTPPSIDQTLAAKLANAGLRPPQPVEARESGAGTPERRG